MLLRPCRPSVIALLLAACAAPPVKAPSGAGASAAPASAAPRILSPAEIAAAALPSVVLIRSPAGFGTGFVVRADGWIVTNLHVIAGVNEASVTLANKKSYPVIEVVNASAEHDLALLRIRAEGLPEIGRAHV